MIAAAAERYGQRLPSIILVHHTLLERARVLITECDIPLEVRSAGGMFINEVWLGKPPGDPADPTW